MDAELALEIEGLHKGFSQASRLRPWHSTSTIPVLRGVDIRIQRGEFVALLGANGAGKTTILKRLAGLLSPDEGSVHVFGCDITSAGAEGRMLVGYVLADERSFHWRLNARENLDFFAKLQGVPRKDRNQRIDHLLRRLDLATSSERMFGQFSTGMKQRLAVARAMLHRPSLLLMDEPTRSIDPTHAAEVWQLVRDEIAEVNGSVVLVTHQLQEALGTCDRIAILADGEIVMDSSAKSLERLTSDLDGFTLGVRGLGGGDLCSLAEIPGIRDIRVATQSAGEQTLEVWVEEGEQPLASFIAELTSRGAMVCSLQRSTPLQGVIERFLHTAARS